MTGLDDSVRLPMSDLDAAATVAAATLHLVSGGAELGRDRLKGDAARLSRAVEADRQRRAVAMLEGCGGTEGFDRFHNRLRILLGIDLHELVAAGVLAADDVLGWKQFSHDPFRFLLRCDDRRAEAIWAIVSRREAGHV